MPRANPSGKIIEPEDVRLILGMVKRDDRRHDIAAWFGINQGRIYEIEIGQHGAIGVEPAPVNELPPRGSPGPRSRALRKALTEIYNLLREGDVENARLKLMTALMIFDRPLS